MNNYCWHTEFINKNIKDECMEKPNSRVHITIEVDNHGQKEQKELPLKLLVLANLTQTTQKQAIAKRTKLTVTKSNFNQTLAALQPDIHLSITAYDRQSDIPVNVCFRQLSDFHPDNIVKQVPHLKELLAMRNVLKDLKANMLDNLGLRQGLKELGQQPRALQRLRHEINHIAEQNDE